MMIIRHLFIASILMVGIAQEITDSSSEPSVDPSSETTLTESNSTLITDPSSEPSVDPSSETTLTESNSTLITDSSSEPSVDHSSDATLITDLSSEPSADPSSGVTSDSPEMTTSGAGSALSSMSSLIGRIGLSFFLVLSI